MERKHWRTPYSYGIETSDAFSEDFLLRGNSYLWLQIWNGFQLNVRSWLSVRLANFRAISEMVFILATWQMSQPQRELRQNNL